MTSLDKEIQTKTEKFNTLLEKIEVHKFNLFLSNYSGNKVIEKRNVILQS